MGFRTGAYASIWSVEPNPAQPVTRGRISISKKNKKTEEYEQDFSGFVTFIGEANTMARSLHEKDRIKICDCDVSTKYDKDKGVEYVNYKIFSFEMADGGTPAPKAPKANKQTAFDATEGEAEETVPF